MFRDLTPEEMSMVSGGIIVVTAPRNSWTFGGSFWGIYSGGAGSSDPGGSSAPVEEELDSDCVDYGKDKDAMTAQSGITNNGNSHSNEFMSLLYMQSGGDIDKTSPVQLPGVGFMSFDPTPAYAQFDATGLGRAAILGSVHNHPFAIYGGSQELIELNRYPSSADWLRADQDIQAGANPELYSLYVIDPMGVMREFKYSENATFRNLNDFQKRMGTFLPSEVSPQAAPQGCIY